MRTQLIVFPRGFIAAGDEYTSQGSMVDVKAIRIGIMDFEGTE
jgi:hypothetical protein